MAVLLAGGSVVLGLVATPYFWVLVVGYAVNPELRKDETARASWWVRARRLERRWFGLIIAPLVWLYLIAIGPWPLMGLFVLVVTSFIAFAYVVNSRPSWDRRLVGAAVGLGPLATIGLLSAYIRGDPLPKVIVTGAGVSTSGPLITANDGLLYVAPAEGGDLFVAIPVARARTVPHDGAAA